MRAWPDLTLGNVTCTNMCRAHEGDASWRVIIIITARLSYCSTTGAAPLIFSGLVHLEVPIRSDCHEVVSFERVLAVVCDDGLS
jgi:hypothetical protein